MLVTSLLAGAAQREAHQQRHRPPGRALLAAALPGGAGDVEMCPAQLAREACEERRRGGRAAGPSADIRHVGEIGAQPGMFSQAGIPPTTLTGAFMPASARIVPSTLPAPDMSNFISSISPAGLSEMPPVSKVMPLPIRARSGARVFAAPL